MGQTLVRLLGCMAIVVITTGCAEDVVDSWQFGCETDDECGPGWVCAPDPAAGHSRCVPEGTARASAETSPGSDGSSVEDPGPTQDVPDVPTDITDVPDTGADIPEQDDTPDDGDEPDSVDAMDAPDVCTPACQGKECGDDGCGGSCGSCKDTDVCQLGACVPVKCTSDA